MSHHGGVRGEAGVIHGQDWGRCKGSFLLKEGILASRGPFKGKGF